MKGRGIEEMIAAASHFKSGIRLYLQGNGLAEKYSSSSNIYLVPPVPANDVVKSLYGYDIGIIPYRPTSLNNQLSSPNKLFDYLMAGMAVAASDLPEIRKIVFGEGVGMLFNPDDPHDIARCINEMAADSERLGFMKYNALNIAAKKYNWEIQSRNLIDCLNKLTIS
jgi:glycosyltransferase involved in cell wall biosynthesis